jgi:hypothetical protein
MGVKEIAPSSGLRECITAIRTAADQLHSIGTAL